MKNLSFLTLFAFLSVSFVVADEPVDEDVEVVAEATMTSLKMLQRMKMLKTLEE